MPAFAVVVLMASNAFQEYGFIGDRNLWADIDSLNGQLSAEGFIGSDTLEALFEEAVRIAFSQEFSDELEGVRNHAFSNGTNDLLDAFAERSLPAISVRFMGESDNVGVNALHFLLKSPPGSKAFCFFDLASDGFYVPGTNLIPGTAELPAWFRQGVSSSQAVVVPSLGARWLAIWEDRSMGFDGYFRTVALATINALTASLVVRDLEAYQQVYSDPFVSHVRNALDSFLEGGREGLSDDPELLRQLAKYQGHIVQRFIVLAVNDSGMGGVEVLLFPCETRDRVFRAWVYRESTGRLQLRGFSVDGDYSAEEVEAFAERYRFFLDDEQHSI